MKIKTIFIFIGIICRITWNFIFIITWLLHEKSVTADLLYEDVIFYNKNFNPEVITIDLKYLHNYIKEIYKQVDISNSDLRRLIRIYDFLANRF